MHRTLFWDVDTQYDFIMPDGSLSIPGAAALLPNLARLTQLARSRPDQVRLVASMDDHTPADPELSAEPDFSSTFPPHCLHGTVGQMKVASTEPHHPLLVPQRRLQDQELQRRLQEHRGEIVILKSRFDVFSNPNTEPIVKHLAPDEIYLYGVALDVCNAYAIEGLLRLKAGQIFLVRDAAEAIDRNRAEKLVEDWKSRGIKLTSTEQVLRQI